MAAVAAGTAVLAVVTLAIEALKQIPDFDERKLKELERERDLLAHAILHEDSDLILTTKRKIGTMSVTYKDSLK